MLLPRLLMVLTLVLAALSSANAVNPDEMLADPALESRARDLSATIRCMKCQNQSIDDSDAELAKDLRLLVRERLVAGDSDQQVLDYLVDRYGVFVLLRPQFSLGNLLLWLAPLLGLLAAAILVFRTFRSHKSAEDAQPANLLSRSEHEKLTKILDESD